MVAVACWLLLTGDGCVMRVPSAGRACGVEEKKETNLRILYLIKVFQIAYIY